MACHRPSPIPAYDKVKAKTERDAESSPFEQYNSSCDFLGRCAANGIILNPAKFQYAQKELDFVGFTIYETKIRPTQMFLDSILMFPYLSSLTNVKVWHGMIARSPMSPPRPMS